MSDGDSQEVHFLHGQNNRAAALVASKAARRQRLESQGALWNDKRKALQSWERRLFSFVTRANRPTDGAEGGSGGFSHKWNVQSLTAQQREEVDNQLRAFEQELKKIGATSIIVSPGQKSDPVVSEEHDTMVAEEEISFSDTKLLHRELTRCMAKLEQFRKTLLPNTRFVFRRYRQAMKDRQERERDANSTNNARVDEQKCLEDTKVKNCSSCVGESRLWSRNEPSMIQGFHDAHILETNTGRWIKKIPHEMSRDLTGGKMSVSLQPSSESDLTESESIIWPSFPLSNGRFPAITSLVLQRMQFCIIELKPEDPVIAMETTTHNEHTRSYSSIHIQHLQNCRLTMEQTLVTGPIHITNCDDSIITIEDCQQLRVHDSHRTEFVVTNKIRSSPILEGCKNITFRIVTTSSDEQQQILMDSKDFDWLRDGVPSPNFQVLVHNEPSASPNELIELIAENKKQEETETPAVGTGGREEGQDGESDDEL